MIDARHTLAGGGWTMKKRTVVLGGVLVACAAPPAHAASGPSANGAGQWISSFGQEVKGSFNAKPDPKDGAKGKVKILVDKKTPEEFSYTGTVTCYFQSGNIARFSGVIDKSEGIPQGFFIWAVEDGGSPGKGVDMIRTQMTTTPQDCVTRVTFLPRNPLLKGDFHVHPSH